MGGALLCWLFVGCRFTDADLRGLRTRSCRFTDCDFTRADLGASEHRATAFHNCTFQRTVLADSVSNKPRRLYRLTPTGVTAARDLLAARRPQGLHHHPRPHQMRPEPGMAFIGWLPTLLAGGAR